MQLKFAAATLGIALALAGCQRTTYSDLGPTASRPSQPAPLAAQPVSGVQSSALPDPTASASANVNSAQFPTAPTAPTAAAGNDQMAAAALDVKKESMVGNWKVSNAGASCDMFLTLTNLGGGSRGGTRGCSGVLTSMGSWEVSGKQVAIKDRSGTVIGNLYKTADSRFDGTLTGGQPVSLSR